MALRAPERGPAPFIEEHTVDGYWEPGRFWVAMKDGKVLAETSNPADEAFQDALDDGAVCYQQRRFVPADHYWVVTEPPVRRALKVDPNRHVVVFHGEHTGQLPQITSEVNRDTPQ